VRTPRLIAGALTETELTARIVTWIQQHSGLPAKVKRAIPRNTAPGWPKSNAGPALALEC